MTENKEQAGQVGIVARAAAPAIPGRPLPPPHGERTGIGFRSLAVEAEGGTMAYSVVDVEDVPYTWGTFKFVRHHIGATAFGFAQIDFPADKVGSEHDESESGQEEVYLTLSGSGTLEVDGDAVEMRPGRYVLVTPSSRRRPAAGPDGMSFLVIGGVPGGVYEPWPLPEE